MQNNDKTRQQIKYVAGDMIASTLAWAAYASLRYCINPELMLAQGYKSLGAYMASPRVALGMVVFPLMMMCVYWLSGYYNEPLRKSRLQECVTTFFSVMCITLAIFFIALVNDMATDRTYNYRMIFLLFTVLLVVVYAVRASITSAFSRRIKNRLWQLDTLVVGTSDDATALCHDINERGDGIGNKVVGFVSTDNTPTTRQLLGLPVYNICDIATVCEREGIAELIIAGGEVSAGRMGHIAKALVQLHIPVKMSLNWYNLFFGRTRLSQISGNPLVDIFGCSLGECQKNIKRTFDVCASAIGMLSLSPLYLALAVWVKCDSRGSAIYSQQRVGRNGKLFNIYKFRSMYVGAESDEPQLSVEDDSRVTKAGRMLRKYRLDELPQLWNILRGDMSFVGPRPEREFFIRQIIERKPSYCLLRQVRPGLTSLGMVKYGYASNIDGMIERMQYDLLYLDNMSLMNDMRILIYTVRTVVTGKGI